MQDNSQLGIIAESGAVSEARLLHHDGVVALKGDIDVHVILHGPNLVGGQEALAPAALAAGLQDLNAVPGGACLEPAADHVDLLPILRPLPHVQCLHDQDTEV